MAVIGRDTYEIVFLGGDDAARQLALMNSRLEDTRRRAFDAGIAFNNLEGEIRGAGGSLRQVSTATDVTDTSITELLRHLELERRELREVAVAAIGAASATRSAGAAVVVASDGFSRGAASLVSLDAATNLVIRGWGALRRAGEVLAQPLGLASSFETEIAAINTISNAAGTRFSNDFLDISRRLGIDAAEVARAGYEAVGSGVAEAILPQFTEIAGKLATAGRAEIQPTLALLTTLQNQFGLSVDGVARASDILFATTKVGVTTIGQLAAELGTIIPTARAAGFDIEKLGAGIAALTKLGNSTAESATQIRSLAVSLSTDGPKLVKAFAEVGVSISEADFRALSLKDQMVLLSNTFSTQQGPLIKALGRIEGVSAALALGKDNGKFFQEALDEITKSAGATDSALAIVQATTEETGRRLKAEFNAQLILLGNQYLPVVNELMVDLTEYLKANGDEIASTIKSAVSSLVSLGTFVVENGDTILTFFGALAGVAVIGSVAKLAGTVTGLATGISGVAAAAGVAKGALGLMLGPVGLLIAALPQLIDLAKELGTSFGNFLASGDQIGNVAQGIINQGLEIQVKQATGDFGTAEALNAARGQVLSGDALLLDPAGLDEARGEFTAKTSEAFATLQEALALGVDQAQVLVEQNIASLLGAADAQSRRSADAIARFESALEAQKAQDAEVERLRFDLGAQLKGTLTEAINKQAEIRSEVARLQSESTFAERRAVQFQDAAEALGNRFTSLLGQVAGAAPFTGDPVDPEPLKGPARKVIDEEGLLEAQAIEARFKLLTAGLERLRSAAEVDAERRVGLIADTNARELAQLQRRHDAELTAAVAAGQDVNLLLQVQGGQRLEILRSQEEAAAQVRAQAQQDYLTQIGRAKEAEAVILRGTDDGAIVALLSRQETELALVGGHLEAERALRETHEREMSLLIAEQNAARITSLAGYADSVGSILGDIAGLMRTFGVESNLLAGVQIAAEAALLQSKAISTAAQAGLSFASGNLLQGTAQAIAAAAAQVQVGVLLAKAASLGAGGGGGGSGSAGAGAPRRSPRVDSARGGGERGAVTFVFQGPVYDSKREAEAAFGRQALRGFRRLQDSPRGAPRARLTDFEG